MSRLRSIILALPGAASALRPTFSAILCRRVEGLHFHTLCESSSYDLEKTLSHVEQRFGHLLPRLKWINMGGGHLMTRKGYDVDHLVSVLKNFKSRYPASKSYSNPAVHLPGRRVCWWRQFSISSRTTAFARLF